MGQTLTLSPATVEAVDAACAADPACQHACDPKRVGALPTTFGGLLALVLPMFGTYGQTFLAMLPLIQEALTALDAANVKNPPAAVVADKMSELAGCR